MASTFFGLTPQYKKSLHQNIFSIVYYGKGGFNFNDVYQMPVYLRNFYLQQFIDAVEQEKKAMEKGYKR